MTDPSIVGRYSETASGCWEWQLARDRDGYGFLTTRDADGKRRYHRANRLAYEEFVGPIPEGLVVDHLCRNRACVNPEHLEAITQTLNLQRAGVAMRERKYCSRGHAWTPENTKWEAGGKRRCRACRRLREGAPTLMEEAA